MISFICHSNIRDETTAEQLNIKRGSGAPEHRTCRKTKESGPFLHVPASCPPMGIAAVVPSL